MSAHARHVLTAEDVATWLGVTPRRVRQIPEGELPYLQLGARGPRRYDPADVERYLAARLRGLAALP